MGTRTFTTRSTRTRAGSPTPSGGAAPASHQPAPIANDEARDARVVAAAVEAYMTSRSGGQPAPKPQPAAPVATPIRTSRTTRQYTTADLEQLAVDFGMPVADLERRRQTLEGDVGEQSFEERRAAFASRKRSMSRFRQFSEMRGRRILVTKNLSKDEVAAQVARGENANPWGQLDTTVISEAGIGQLAAGFIAYMGVAQNNPSRAASLAMQYREGDMLVRALSEATAGAGGVLVPDDVSEDIIELLYAVNAYLQGNPVRMQLVNGVLTLPRVAAGVTASWIGASPTIAAAQQSFDAPRIVLRYLAALVPWANRLALHTPQALQSIIINDLVNGASNLIDLACFRGSGVANEPLGLEQNAGVTRAQSGTTVAAMTQDMGNLDQQLDEQKVSGRRVVFMSPRTKWAYMTARDGNNNLVWADEMVRGTFMGKAYFSTTNIPRNLGGGLNESLTFNVAMDDEIYAEGVGSDGRRIQTVDGAAYHDGVSTVSGFAQDESVTKLIESADRVSRRNGLNIGKITGVTIAA